MAISQSRCSSGQEKLVSSLPVLNGPWAMNAQAKATWAIHFWPLTFSFAGPSSDVPDVWHFLHGSCLQMFSHAHFVFNMAPSDIGSCRFGYMILCLLYLFRVFKFDCIPLFCFMAVIVSKSCHGCIMQLNLNKPNQYIICLSKK